jgi:hypothetical protein
LNHEHRFWTLLEELGPTLPLGGDVEWSATLETIVRWMKTRGLQVSEGTVETALESAERWNPGWGWSVEKRGDWYRFTPRHGA